MTTRAVLRGVVQDAAGNTQGSRSVKVCQFGTSTPVVETLYGSRTGLTPISTTLTTDPTTGAYECWKDGPGGPPVTVLDLTTGSSEVASFVPDSPVTETDTQTITNKTLTAPVIGGAGTLSGSGSLTGNSFTLQAKIRDAGGVHFNVQTFGALGDGATDDTTAILAAVAAAEVWGYGAEVFFPYTASGYRVSQTIRCHQGIKLRGAVFGDIDPNLTGSGHEATLLTWIGADSGGPVIQFKATSSATCVGGGDIDGLVVSGGNKASTGVHFASPNGSRITWLRVRECKTRQVLVDDSNGILARNMVILYLEVNYGSAAATQTARGLEMDGSSGFGCTTNTIVSLSGQHYSGPLLYMGYADNNLILNLHSSGVITGTGYGIQFFDSVGGTKGATGNIFVKSMDRVLPSTNAIGNVFLHHTSEHGNINAAAAGVTHYLAEDWIDQALYQTHRYVMTDELHVPAAAMHADANVVYGEVSSLWGAWSLHATSTSKVSSWVRPYHWPSGTVTTVRVFFAMGSANTSKAITVRVRGFTAAAPAAAGSAAALTPAEFDVAVAGYAIPDAASLYQYLDITLNQAYTRGDAFLFLIQREPADGGDTAVGVVNVLGATLFFTATGPDTGSVGTYTVSAPHA